MLKKFIIYTFVIMTAAVLFTGCAKAPVQLAETTKQAVEEAKTTGIDRFFTVEFNALNDSLNIALAEIEAEKAKSAISRKFTHAESLLVFVGKELNTLTQKIEARKEEVKAQVEQNLIDLVADVQEVAALVKSAPKNKAAKTVVDSLKLDLNNVETSIDEIKSLLANGDLLAAQNKAIDNTEALQTITLKLQELASKK